MDVESRRRRSSDDHRGSISIGISRLLGSSSSSASPSSFSFSKAQVGQRSAMSAADDRHVEELRRHIHAVAMGHEQPLPASGRHRRQSSDLGRTGPNKLRSKRRPNSVPTPQRFVEYNLSDKEATMAPTIAIQPIRTTGFDMGPPDLYPISEDGQIVDSPTSPTRSSIQSYPMYPGLQSPTRASPRSFDPAYQVLNTPRKLSSSSTVSASTVYSRETARSEMVRASSWGSKSSFDSSETTQWRPDGGYHRPEPLKGKRRVTQQGEAFLALPDEVLGVILEMLKQLHLRKGSNSCSTCWMRDVCSISLCSRKLVKSARNALYQDIWLVGMDSATHRKKYKMAQGARMLMLRHTLRANSGIAALVRSLKVPRPDTTIKGFNTKSLEQYEDLLASLVMACPNLETLSGPITTYDHSFKRLFHALSTRRNLKEMDWLIEPSALQSSPSSPTSPRQSNGSTVVVPGNIKPFQEGEFLDYHRLWTSLSSLSIHCLPGGTISPNTLLTRALSMLPALQHLHLCNLPSNAFNDETLRSLPPLQTLSLTHINGVTANGLSTMATCETSQALRTLHLRHTPLTSLPALARLLSNLRSLTTLSVNQGFPPLMPEADSFMLWMMPYLASGSLRKLHWDITSCSDSANVADGILARSIAAGGFPQLRLLRAPNDPEGIFQDLCRPVERMDLPGDRFCGNGSVPDMAGAVTVSSPIEAPSPTTTATRFLTKTPKSPISPSSSAFFSAGPGENPSRPPTCTNLRAARVAAQARLERAQKLPRFSVNVFDDDGSKVESFAMAGFIGTVGSPISYHLHPDPGSCDQRGGIVDARDLAGDAGESLAAGREGCSGTWNRTEGVVADKKEKERWWHTERGRWTRIEL